MQQLALEALPEFTKIHAGCANWDGKRLIAAGPARSGKSTLMTRLLYEGFTVHCDDIVLLRRGEVLPYPERFSIRPGTLALIPQLAPLAAPFLGQEGRGNLTLDPSELGFEWRVDPGPVDTVLFLEPDHGGATRLDACPKYSMAERIMAQSSLPAGGAREWVRDICGLIDRADCYVLRSGDLESSISMVKEILRNASGCSPGLAASSTGGT